MPPKKKTKAPNRAADADSPAPEPVIFDGWTDEQETTLFKAISVYRLKPAGMHKHFRIIGISELMKNHGVSDIHTGVEGIWRKLQSLYNLEGLDEREDLEEDGSPDPGVEFTLPDEDFGTLMHARRLDPNSADSPVRLSTFTFTPAPRGKKGRVMRSVSADGSRTARTSSIIADDTEDELSLKSASPVPRKTKIVSTRGRKLGFGKGRGRGLKKMASPRRKPPATPKPAEESAEEESESSSTHDASDDELSEVPDEDDDDVAEAESDGEAESEGGESTTAAESPAPTRGGDVRRSTRKK
ncbi:CT20-domain-containing protein [Morchella conica CCBAS932]|uniref:CT20-domain-containing protein n=1 Tax=Morchella conica CCBAS932 TaxID=1392247 RepID=A0A3N4KMK0_9PEZI|nr:CT20-domain-containing protein [Morchella conica CCBAS932]